MNCEIQRHSEGAAKIRVYAIKAHASDTWFTPVPRVWYHPISRFVAVMSENHIRCGFLIFVQISSIDRLYAGDKTLPSMILK